MWLAAVRPVKAEALIDYHPAQPHEVHVTVGMDGAFEKLHCSESLNLHGEIRFHRRKRRQQIEGTT